MGALPAAASGRAFPPSARRVRSGTRRRRPRGDRCAAGAREGGPGGPRRSRMARGRYRGGRARRASAGLLLGGAPPARPAVSVPLVGLDDLLDERMADDVALVEVDELDSGDPP